MDKQNAGNEKERNEKERNNYTLIINYPVLGAGGIETCLVALMRYYLKQGNRVIWLTTTRYRHNVAFKGLLETPGLEIVIWENWSRLFDAPRIVFGKNERVIMITCRAMHYIAGEALVRKAGTREFKHIYTVAHHSGPAYYPDRRMKTVLGKQLAYWYWKRILMQLVEKNCLFGFAPVQLDNYEAHYHVSIPNKMECLMPFVGSELGEFDEENAAVREQERKNRFIITTCARFEFPHKGYMLGLVDSFCLLKEKYPHVVLQIIGDGENREALIEKVSNLPDKIRRDIILTGIVSPDNLNGYYKNSHVIVGLAGAIMNGARSGIPSIVVRHNCNECEAYGFYEDAFEKSLCEEPGEDITSLLEQCITMSREEYLGHGRAGFQTVEALLEAVMREQKAEVASRFYFARSASEEYTTTQKFYERITGRILYVITELKNRFER